MKFGFYPRLAWTGMRKNWKLYGPYFLTCVGCAAMYYIISFLYQMPAMQQIRGGRVLVPILAFGTGVVGFFSLIFLFYTSAFLIRRRKKEFGLYHILGMGKRNLTRIFFWENAILYGITMLLGLLIGTALSKLAELWLLHIIKSDVNYDFSVSFQAMLQTAVLFGVIFILLFFNGLRQISRANGIELLRSEQVGERKPKANWGLGLLGVLCLAVAYTLALRIKDPVAAMLWFFIAVLLVILGTYLVMIAGSVTLCALLQRQKRYYYQKAHFVSLSSMRYRMKRNGAGLASICILATMVLVMLCSTTCLYFGGLEHIESLYPDDVMINVLFEDAAVYPDEEAADLQQAIERVAVQAGTADYRSYKMAVCHGSFKDGIIRLERTDETQTGSGDWQRIVFVPLQDFCRITGSSQTLGENEILLGGSAAPYADSLQTLQLENTAYSVAGAARDFPNDAFAGREESILLIVPDLSKALAPMMQTAALAGSIRFQWYAGISLDAGEQAQIELMQQFQDARRALDVTEGSSRIEQYLSKAEQEADFYGSYGGLFFLGVLFSVIFVFAAVLILYYKQISEGYEDQRRFEIMQNVGMTKRDIRKSINAQLLVVFFSPLLLAGVHLGFAFPFLYKMLQLFELSNVQFLLQVTVIGFLAFAVFYVLVYRLTSNVYYKIISGGETA